MTKRGHISWKTKCAAALLDAQLIRERFGLHPRRWYDDAKQMTEDQFLSLFQFDHNMLHEIMLQTDNQDRDMFWNLTPMLIQAHREKTKTDIKAIAKGRRIRGKRLLTQIISWGDDPKKWDHDVVERYVKVAAPRRKLRSRGFDKTKRRTMRGKVVPR